MRKLDRDFYNKSSIDAAKELLGKYLVHLVDGKEVISKIVETEAYMGPMDKAAHSYGNRRTKRTEVMFGPPGIAYVFLIYGMYSCMNVVVEEVGKPQAVLIRGCEPAAGLEVMAERRYGKAFDQCTKREILSLTNGPGKLCMAMGITVADNGQDLCSDSLYIAEKKDMTVNGSFDEANIGELEIVTTTRINIDYAEEAIHFPWRFYIKGNKYVSVL